MYKQGGTADVMVSVVVAIGIVIGVGSLGWWIAEAKNEAVRRRIDKAAEEALFNTLCGVVTSVTDGDTLMLTTDDAEYKIRLACIDAPERNQPGGKESTAALTELVKDKPVTVKVIGIDRYKRKLGVIFLGKANVNTSMVALGHAWHYTRYSDSKRLTDLQSEAMLAKLGLWAADNPIPPWEWRKGKR